MPVKAEKIHDQKSFCSKKKKKNLDKHKQEFKKVVFGLIKSTDC